jgi:hypothetical protein
VTKEEQSVLETLDEIIQAEEIDTQLWLIVERVHAELARKADALMTWESISLKLFGDRLPAVIRSAWVFVLRAGADTGAERHPNSHQRMMTLAGVGDMKVDARGIPHEVGSESEIVWRSNLLTSEANAPLNRRWISIPQNVWHRPVISNEADWVVLSFHTVPATQLIEERPGAKQMWYESKRKQNNPTSS